MIVVDSLLYFQNMAEKLSDGGIPLKRILAALCLMVMLSVASIGVSANVGYLAASRLSGSGFWHNVGAGAGGAAGGWAGAKVGAMLGSWGGPVGMIIGAGLGAG